MEQTPPAAGGQASFDALLRSLRAATGLSQEELAHKARISVDAVSALERGTRTQPYPATVRALAEALELTPQERAALLSAVPRRTRGRPRNGATTTVRGQLPAAATPLVGREQDIAAVSELLGSARLVTLTGTGGVGKSRLAIAVAGRLSAIAPDGVAFVPLSHVQREELALSQIGLELGLESGDRTDSEAAVLDALTSLRLLMVMDNAEHLPGLARIVADLLSSCPGVTVLATSRSPLQIRGETEYQVRPLDLPNRAAQDSSLVLQSPAASLFIARGQAVRHDLVIGPDDVSTIVAICHRLAGLPLALEIAAAGLRTLDPRSLLTQLDDVLDIPGAKDLPERQHTLRSTLDWSYALLTADDRGVFRRLSVLVGGFTLEAAQAVAGPELAAGAVQRLVTQSLCTVTAAADGRLRFGMLELVAQYGRTLLTPQENASARTSHAEFFLSLAEQATAGYDGDHQIEWLRRLDEETGNLSSAVEWAVHEGLGDLAGRFVWALWMYWWMRGRLTWARQLVDQALLLDMPDGIRARALIAAGGIAEPGTATDRVERRYAEALNLAQLSDDHEAQASAALALGGIALERQDEITAETRLRNALDSAEAAGERGPWYAGHAHVLLGAARRALGDPSGAIRHIQAGLEFARRRHDGVATTIALYNLALADLALGRPHPARQHMVEAALLCQQARDTPNLSLVLDALAVIEAPTAEPERIVTLLGAAQGIRSTAGSTPYGFYADDHDLRERVAEDARRALGDDAYLRALGAGRVLSPDHAVEFAVHADPRRGRSTGRKDGYSRGGG